MTLQYYNTKNSSLWAPAPLLMKGRTKLELGAKFLKKHWKVFLSEILHGRKKQQQRGER